MKPSSLLGLLCLVMSFCACQKDKAVPTSGSLTFAFQNTAYTANDARGFATDTTVVGKKVLTIEGITGNLTKHIALTVIFPDSLAVGTYTQNNGAYILWSPSLSGGVTSYLSTTATIKITSINSKYAEGTFAGILENGEKEEPLTDGIFKVNIY
ncbi:hypothetical protein [Chitinophaga sancti]|uniref:DUF4402 domain-containing protein n=1 Tax=Chitinophaga sancti TaxID=1004 RepID=A0A1K1NUX1_9BACT|nr:hypothetical protein [Chitinophaga sancti]WQD60150.1 hypothetical protein U0033_19870 [Chitinophaga sancti]WQG87722.1 hypothetical protein SR876_22600 [Chitinophaga sancti]SFW38222.1 hypothetical protein SAMN05661012_01444 [Chitinophaga sancti]